MLAVAAAVALGGALFGPFPVREVTVVGLSRIDQQRVREAAALAGANVFLASARGAESRVAAIPGVRRAHVSVLLPDRASIEVEERVPAIVVSASGASLFADDDGVLFAGAGASEGLATLEDETARRASGGRIDPALVLATRAIGTREPAYFGRAIQRIRLTGAFGLVVLLQGGIELRLGGAEQVDAKLEIARQIVLSRAGRRLDYVDVRDRENPVYFPRD